MIENSFAPAGVPISVTATPTSFLYGAEKAEGVAYCVNASEAVDSIQFTDSSGNSHAVPVNPNQYILLPYGKYAQVFSVGGAVFYVQPGFLNKKRNLFDDRLGIFDKDAANIFNAFTTSATVPRKHLINMTVGALKGFDLWNRMVFLTVLAAETDQAARLNWAQFAPQGETASSYLSLSESGAPTFVADRGYTVSSTDGLRSSGFGNINLTRFHTLFYWELDDSSDSNGNGTLGLSIYPGGGLSKRGVSGTTNRYDAQFNAPNNPVINAPNNTYIGYRSVCRHNSIKGEGARWPYRVYSDGTVFASGENTINISSTRFMANLVIGSSGSSLTFTGLQPVFGVFINKQSDFASDIVNLDKDNLNLYAVCNAYLSIVGAI